MSWPGGWLPWATGAGGTGPTGTRVAGWVHAGSGAALALLTIALILGQWPVLVILTTLAPAGRWLAAVDLDVQRLTDKIIFPLLGWLLFTVMITAIVTRDLVLLGGPQVAAWSPTSRFGLLHLLSRGALGSAMSNSARSAGSPATMIS